MKWWPHLFLTLHGKQLWNEAKLLITTMVLDTEATATESTELVNTTGPAKGEADPVAATPVEDEGVVATPEEATTAPSKELTAATKTEKTKTAASTTSRSNGVGSLGFWDCLCGGLFSKTKWSHRAGRAN